MLSTLCFDGIQEKNSVEISHMGISVGVYMKICLMTLHYQVGHVGGILGSLQISSFGLHTWKILRNLSCSSGSGQFLPLLGWLPGFPSFPSAKSSPFFECLSPILLVSNRRYLLNFFFFNHVKNILFSQTRVLFGGGKDRVLPSWWAQLIEESPIQSICSAMAILNVAAEDLHSPPSAFSLSVLQPP